MVHNAMYEIAPDQLEERLPPFLNKKKKPKKGIFVSMGPDFYHSLDGHDKLMG